MNWFIKLHLNLIEIFKEMRIVSDERLSHYDKSPADKSPNWRKDAKNDETKKQSDKSDIKKSSENNDSNWSRRDCFRCGKPDHTFRTCENSPLKEWKTRKKHLVMMGIASDSDEDSEDEENS